MRGLRQHLLGRSQFKQLAVRVHRTLDLNAERGVEVDSVKAGAIYAVDVDRRGEIITQALFSVSAGLRFCVDPMLHVAVELHFLDALFEIPELTGVLGEPRVHIHDGSCLTGIAVGSSVFMPLG